MEIFLKELNLKTNENKGYKKLIDNSYAEWSINWNNSNNGVEKNSWDAKFEIISENKIGHYSVNTEENFLTYINLEGYLEGEEFLLENGLSLKIGSYSSNVLVAIVFSEAIRLGILDDDEISYFSMLIFPEWSRGLIPTDVLDEEDVKELFDETLEILGKKDILKLYPIKLVDIDVKENERKEDFIKFSKNYIEKDLFFYTLNINN